MPNDISSQEIATRGALAISRTSAGTFSIAPQNMAELIEFAKLMSMSTFCVRPAFRGNPGACLAVALQAFRCGGDPFAWANKAYITRNKAGDEQISYEAQLIHATVNASPVLAQRLRPHYEGSGATRKCTIVGYIRGEEHPFEYESPEVGKIAVKNSPLWTADPDQQLFYYSSRAWARRHVPEILLGMYAPDEFETIDMAPGPEPRREDFVEPEAIEHDEGPVFSVIDLDGVEHEFGDSTNAAAALIKILGEAAKMDLKRLDGAWESNEGSVALWPLSDEARQELRAGYERLRSLNPAPAPRRASPARESVKRNQADAPPPSPPPAPAETPVQDVLGMGHQTPAAAPDPRAVREGAQSEFPTDIAQAKRPFPGDMPAGRFEDAKPKPLYPERAPAVIEVNDPLGLGPEPTSLAIAPPMRRGAPDWRTWAIALFLPHVRRCTDTNDLAFLVGDNDANLTLARADLDKADLAAMDEAIAQKFKELGDAD
jgi:hypothetical protein